MIAFRIPLVDGSVYAVSEAEVVSLQNSDRYREINVRYELERAVKWVAAGKGQPENGAGFVRGWLNRRAAGKHTSRTVLPGSAVRDHPSGVRTTRAVHHKANEPLARQAFRDIFAMLGKPELFKEGSDETDAMGGRETASTASVGGGAAASSP